MIFTTHRSGLDSLPASSLKPHIQSLFNNLSDEQDTQPSILFIESKDDPKSPDFHFIEDFHNCFEWVHHDIDHRCYIALHLAHGELGTYLIIPDSVALAHPELLLALHSQPLLETLPF